MMSITTFQPDADGEILRPAFPDVEEAERPYTQLSYGIPFEKAIRKYVDGSLKSNKVYIIASKGLASKTDHLRNLETALGDKHVGTWMGVPAHSPYDSLIPILHDIRQKQADCLVTLGGGSLADGAKLLSYALENGVESVDDLIQMEKPFLADLLQGSGVGNAPKVDLIFTPTTLSGAEYSKFAGCTNPTNNMKVQFTHPRMFAKLIVLDGNLCRTTPDWVWRSTGVRAIDHCVENICSTNSRHESDVACERGLRRLVKSLLAYVRNANDLDARLESQLGCNNAMTGLTLLVYCGASHGIGHNLGPLGVGHGQTSCILLPSVMKYNARVNRETQERIKEVLWTELEIAEVLTKRGLQRNNSDAGDALRAIFNELGMPKSLEEVGVRRDQWSQLAENSLADHFLAANPISMTEKEQVMEILEMCSGS